MSSSYLDRPLRTQAQASRDGLANLGDLYFFLQQGRYGLEPMERDFPVSWKQAVKDYAEGQYEGCVVILRGEIGGKLEDVTEDILAEAREYELNVMLVEHEPPEREYEHEDAT